MPLITLQQKVCAYLKKKILEEEEESKVYHRIEQDARQLTNGHVYLDVLLQAQSTEEHELMSLYRELCVNKSSESIPVKRGVSYRTVTPDSKNFFGSEDYEPHGAITAADYERMKKRSVEWRRKTVGDSGDRYFTSVEDP